MHKLWILNVYREQTFYCFEGVYPHDQYLDWNHDLVGSACELGWVLALLEL